MKVVRVTLTEFETENGSVYPILPTLEKLLTPTEFQVCYDRATQLVLGVKDVGDHNDDPSSVEQRGEGEIRPQCRRAPAHPTRRSLSTSEPDTGG